jgi:hypothetical protein
MGFNSGLKGLMIIMQLIIIIIIIIIINGKLKDLILLFKIPMGKRKDFFEVYRHIRHAPYRRSASPETGPSSSVRRLPDGAIVSTPYHSEILES